MQQIETVWKSVLLAQRQNEQYDYELYQIDGFYAEVRYLKGERLVSRLMTFANPDLLEPYLGMIDIDSLTR